MPASFVFASSCGRLAGASSVESLIFGIPFLSMRASGTEFKNRIVPSRHRSRRSLATSCRISEEIQGPAGGASHFEAPDVTVLAAFGAGVIPLCTFGSL